LGSHDGADVDERLGGDGLHVLGGHALAHDAFHAREADPHLVLDQLADRPDPAIGEMVLVVEPVPLLVAHQVQQVGGGGQQFGDAQRGLIGRRGLDVDVEDLSDALDLLAELAVQLVAPHPREVVPARVEVRAGEIGAGRLGAGLVAGPHPLVDLDEGVVAGQLVALLVLPLRGQEVEVGHEAVEESGVGVLVAEPQRRQEGEEAEATLARHPHAGADVPPGPVLHVELDPLPAVGMDRPGHELVLGHVPQPVALAGLEDDAGRPHELRHHHPLGAVDDEGALGGHLGEVPHEDHLLLDLAGVAVQETRPHEDGRAVGHVLFLALLHGELGIHEEEFVIGIELELQEQVLGVVLDGTDVREDLRQALVEEPVEGITLDGDQIGKVENLLEIAERVAPASDRGGTLSDS